MASAAKYAQDEENSGDRSNKGCAEAGRQCVRKIQMYSILSVEWINLLEDLKKLARLVQLEGRYPANTKVTEIQGRSRESEGTLWDQEAHETAIRILVEEAKVNLCLRIMNEYKKWEKGPEKEPTVHAAIKNFDYSEVQIEAKLAQFEESLGLLLWRALVHVETLQLMDIPLLIEHISMILVDNARAGSPATNIKMQETVVLCFFASLMKHAEALNNAELLAKAREYRLLQLATDQILKHVESYPSDIIVHLASGLAALADNEDFRTCWKDFFATEDGQTDRDFMQRFLLLEEQVAGRVLKDSPDKKKELRPLLDLCKLIQRTL